MTTDNAQLARIEQKLDSLDERLFNGGTGIINTLASEQKDLREKVSDLTTAQAVLKAEARKDARWTAGIIAFIGVLFDGALISLFGHK